MTKQEHQMIYDRHLLSVICSETGRPVSAGEFARVAGVARNTARRRLLALVVAGLARMSTRQHVNGAPCAIYSLSEEVS